MNTFFDHEKLKVYREALRFYSWCEPILDRPPKSADVRDQLDRARTSVALNIPEGNGKSTSAEQELEEGKTMLQAIVSMLIGLIRSNSHDRLYEEPVEYRVGN